MVKSFVLFETFSMVIFSLLFIHVWKALEYGCRFGAKFNLNSFFQYQQLFIKVNKFLFKINCQYMLVLNKKC